MNDKVLERIDALAAKLGVAASKIWTIYVQQARIEAIKDTVIAALFLCLAGACVWGALAIYKDDNPRANADSSDDLDLAAVVTGAALVATCVAIWYGSAAVVEFANPEYWALKELMEAAK